MPARTPSGRRWRLVLLGLAALLSLPAEAAGGEVLRLAFLRAAAPQVDADEAAPAAAGREIPEARRAIDTVDLYDPANPDRQKLQRIDEATRHLPYDANGFPDWMKALNDGLIKPRSKLGGGEAMEVLDLDVVMRNTREMPFVKFPHRSHTLWLACSNCHPDPFPAKAGATAIRMADIFRGQFCGKCHDRVAFITFFSCVRCHSVPQSQYRPPRP